jgi:hypothetical protein
VTSYYNGTQIASHAWTFLGGQLELQALDLFPNDAGVGVVYYDNISLSSAGGQTVPAPGALLLGGIGTGIATWFRRRRLA